MTSESVRSVMAGGLAMVCAVCRRYWDGGERGLHRCTGKNCAGPPGGGLFEEYVGPLTDEAMQRWCYRCGADSQYVVCKPGSSRKVGVCKEHIQDLVALKAVEGTIRTPSGLFVKREGTLLTIEEVVPEPPKTLGRLIAETEEEWGQDA